MAEPGRRRALRVSILGAGCLAVLSVMLVLHAWPLWTGETLHLLVPRPVDPRDPFRGEFVILGYEFSSFSPLPAGHEPTPSIPGDGMAPGLPTVGALWERMKVSPESEWRELRHLFLGERYCLQLQKDEGHPDALSVYRAVSVSDRVEPGWKNLCGLVTGTEGAREVDGAGHLPVLRMRFGIGALYVKEGSGVAIERAMREESPVYAEIALTGSGRGRLRHLIIEGAPVPSPER